MFTLPENQILKIQVGKFRYPVRFNIRGKKYWLSFPYNPELLKEIKAMQGAKWHGFDATPVKQWSIDICDRNHFQLAYLTGIYNPYEQYDKELEKVIIPSQYPIYVHQGEFVNHAYTRKQCIIAGEMGTGKTLAVIILMDMIGGEWWYIAPKSALRAVEVEFMRWKLKNKPKLFTYNAIVKIMKDWTGAKAPRGIIFDESSRCKNPVAQRTQACLALANGVRSDWGKEGFVILMSGSPAPKSPLDWWSQCEIACPGFLKEGSIRALRDRLAITEKNETFEGAVYQKIVSWKDSPTKCNICGREQTDAIHDFFSVDYHEYVKSVDEVSKLYARMKGLVLVKFKKDCIDLPDKIYRVIRVNPTEETKRLAKLIEGRASSAIQALTELRELSDGFLYKEEKTGDKECPVCSGKKVMFLDGVEQICDGCDGKGKVDITTRVIKEFETPKEEILEDLLDEHEEIGRLVVYAGFEGSILRCIKIAQKAGWSVFRADGKGWCLFTKDNIPIEGNPLDVFQYKLEEHPKICFIGQPGAAGMGLTLTASPTIFYYSNDFNAESRIQSEDRIHRIGMDINKGATIIDVIHLPSDEIVLNNLTKKRELQALTLGEIKEMLK